MSADVHMTPTAVGELPADGNDYAAELRIARARTAEAFARTRSWDLPPFPEVIAR